MNRNHFKSDRHFTLFDFLISHGHLLLRSMKNDVDENNIDIIFFGVEYIQLRVSLLGLSIGIVGKDKFDTTYESVKGFLKNDNSHVFEIETRSEKFHLVASHFKVYENQLEFNESRVSFWDVDKRGKELIE